jgi:hypothetical protein
MKKFNLAISILICLFYLAQSLSIFGMDANGTSASATDAAPGAIPLGARPRRAWGNGHPRYYDQRQEHKTVNFVEVKDDSDQPIIQRVNNASIKGFTGGIEQTASAVTSAIIINVGTKVYQFFFPDETKITKEHLENMKFRELLDRQHQDLLTIQNELIEGAHDYVLKDRLSRENKRLKKVYYVHQPPTDQTRILRSLRTMEDLVFLASRFNALAKAIDLEEDKNHRRELQHIYDYNMQEFSNKVREHIATAHAY